MIDAMMCTGQAFIREWKANFKDESDKIKAGVEEFCEWIQTECFDESKLDWIVVSACLHSLDYFKALLCNPLPCYFARG